MGVGHHERHQGREKMRGWGADGQTERERETRDRMRETGRKGEGGQTNFWQAICGVMVPCRLIAISQSHRNRWPFELSINPILL